MVDINIVADVKVPSRNGRGGATVLVAEDRSGVMTVSVSSFRAMYVAEHNGQPTEVDFPQQFSDLLEAIGFGLAEADKMVERMAAD